MAENQVKITYHIYLEAEDVSQSRILSSTSYVKNLFKNCGNHYFQGVDFDDEVIWMILPCVSLWSRKS